MKMALECIEDKDVEFDKATHGSRSSSDQTHQDYIHFVI